MTRAQLPAGAKLWLLSLLLCAIFVPLVFRHLDLAIALRMRPWATHLAPLGEGLGSAILLSIEALLLLYLSITRVVVGSLRPFGRTLALATLASVCAYAVNSTVLKVAFGVPAPWEVWSGAHHGIHFLKGTGNSSFPSGHMALAGAFCGVFFRLYRSSVVPLGIFMLLAATLLVAGVWHFVSDVIAGSFLGISAGLLAGEVWYEHIHRQQGIAAAPND
ncbi:membrane-associated phospholipid phosphatase [Rhizomicrobium palustre]|uniref:Membrane-associated phospholipid phosphatase n=1 Tax=Rhizomicrobium palustre TaxID=189966 RepID=A0A846MUM5_9PROT|nr:phosphatase PAP2 family protein [Rhizomicrobium palustre]NIK86935.1 membrane-associated phospholipid phosphatase [Rhizomicrobium palustre]